MTKSLGRFVVSHPTGNTFVRALLNHLNNQNQLEKFFTTIGAGEGANPWMTCFCRGKRHYAIPDKMISRQWMPEITRILSKGDQAKKRQRTDQSYLDLDNKVSHKLCNFNSQVLHAYEVLGLVKFLSLFT